MTRQALYKIQFYGTAEDPVKVGDKIEFSGIGTVVSIAADLIDINNLGGTATEFALGGLTIELAANKGNVKGAA